MWFYDTPVGTFCIRYMREGYGLFLDGDCLQWQREAETAAEKVSRGTTGYAPWDTLEGVPRPAGLGEWRRQEPTASPIRPNDDPLIIPIRCSCGHEFSESVARLRSVQDLCCPSCKAPVRMERDRLLELIGEAREKREHQKKR